MFELEPPSDDALFAPKVGPWSADKHHFLRRYIDIFTTGMKDRNWKGLHYIDLFAGAGIEGIGDDHLSWGSPLIAAQAPNQFSRLHLCELKRKPFDALERRIQRFEQPTPPQLIRGDANKIVHEIVRSIPPGSLSLAFLDPHGLHLHFDTLRALSKLRSDLIIFFPDHLDALRNWQKVYAGQPDSNLDLVLGTGRWHDALTNSAKQTWPHVLRRIYEEQIRSLKYEYFDYERITLPTGRPLYLLMFCSRHERGGQFWRKIASKNRGGQKTFDFE